MPVVESIELTTELFEAQQPPEKRRKPVQNVGVGRGKGGGFPRDDGLPAGSIEAQLLNELMGGPLDDGRSSEARRVAAYREMKRKEKEILAEFLPKKQEEDPAISKQVVRQATKKVHHLTERALSARDDFLAGTWPMILDRIRLGEKVGEVLKYLGVTRQYINGILRSDNRAREQWREARLAGVWVEWDPETVDAVLLDIAGGMTVKEAVTVKRALQIQQFYWLVLNDPHYKIQYEEAQQIRMEGMADEILEISNDGKNDYHASGRVNSENINRSKLRADNMKWVMSKLHHKRFGDRIQQDQNIVLTVDHESQLTAARKRKEKLLSERAVSAAAVVAVTS